jgi:CheY-like chemotaxis protein
MPGPQSHAEPRSQRTPATILLIDDDLVSREVMATVLTMSGYTVHTAQNGAESIELLAGGACTPSVILMDAQMPGLQGTQLIAELRARSGARIFVVSASNPAAEVSAVADGLLLKPFTVETFRELIDEHAAPASALPSPVVAALGEMPVVDPESLANLRAMMPESDVRQIYAALIADLESRKGALEEAIDLDDIAAIRLIGHAIKGGCGMAGAKQAAHLGRGMEEGTWGKGPGEQKGNDSDNMRAVLEALGIAIWNLERMLEREFPA